MPTLSQTRVRRRAIACARCRSRKTLCDGLSPSCSRCLKAGVPCVAPGSSTEKTAPRSIVQYLETRIAVLERRGHTRKVPTRGLLNHDVPARARASAPVPVPPRPALEEKNNLPNIVIKDFTPSFLGLTAAVPLVRCAVAGTRLPSTRLFGTTDIDWDHPRSILNPVPNGTPLCSIPVGVADFLFDNYMTRIIPQYPIFHSSDIISFFNSVYHNPDPNIEPGVLSTAYEKFIVSLIMAISLSTAARTQQVRANSIAIGLFRSAMQQIHTVCTNDLAGLQALLVLLQYTFLDPSAANLWFLSGFTIQACIDLGLHKESPNDQELDPLTRDIRRRVFWCAYEMEVAACAGLLRPISLLSKDISVPFPSAVEDAAISSAGIDPNGRTTKFAALFIWEFRQIEAEIVSVLFLGGELPSGTPSIDEWMIGNEMAINSWHEEVKRSAALNDGLTMESQWREMSLYADIARAYILITLFRPCPLVKEPSSENLMKAFVAAVKVADGYWRQSNLEFGNSKYVFHPCHHTFSAAVVFLQALQRCKEKISITYTLDEVEGFMSCFSRFFATIAERWPAASRCLEEYERLLAPAKREYIDFTVQKARDLPHDATPFGSFVTYQGNMMNPAWGLSDLVEFGPLFQPGEPSPEDRTALAYTMPIDWNAEFDFGMN